MKRVMDAPDHNQSLWTRDRPVLDTSTWGHKETERDATGVSRTRNPSKQESIVLILRPSGHLYLLLGTTNSNLNLQTELSDYTFW
jgi:hypothetical protein